MKMFLKMTVLVCGFGLLSGCATILGGGSTQQINVEAVDAQTNKTLDGAVCQIKDGKGMTYSIEGNPGATEVTRGQGALAVTCHKKGYKQSKVAAGNSFNAWMLGDVLFWPGAIVDGIDGSAEKYPSHLTVIMQPLHMKS